MSLRFTKMHGLGNDFLVLDGVRQTLPDQGPPLPLPRLRELAHRRFGVGFDQLLLIQPALGEETDFRYRIFNADGSEVGQCGNGARCVARFIHEEGLSDRRDLRVDTASGRMVLHLTDDGQVTVDMGQPRWAPADIPFLADQDQDSHLLVAGHNAYDLTVVSLGNPHAVMLVESVDTAPVDTVGPLLEAHERFPERVNVGFMQVVNREHIRLRVFERGSGETLACGSGACAAVVAGQRRGWLDQTVQVDLPGGRLQIEHAPDGPVRMTGPATRVFDGVLPDTVA